MVEDEFPSRGDPEPRGDETGEVSELDGLAMQLSEQVRRWAGWIVDPNPKSTWRYEAPDRFHIFTLTSTPMLGDAKSPGGVVDKDIVGENITVDRNPGGSYLSADMLITYDSYGGNQTGRLSEPRVVRLTYKTKPSGFRRILTPGGTSVTVHVHNGRFVQTIAQDQLPALRKAIKDISVPGAMTPLSDGS
jgi:hypothetical protein